MVKLLENRGRGYHDVKNFVTINQAFDFELFDHIFIIQCMQLRTFLNTGTEVVVIMSKNLL